MEASAERREEERRYLVPPSIHCSSEVPRLIFAASSVDVFNADQPADRWSEYRSSASLTGRYGSSLPSWTHAILNIARPLIRLRAERAEKAGIWRYTLATCWHDLY